MKKLIIFALAAPLFLGCGNALLTDAVDPEWAGGQTVTTNPVEPSTPEEPKPPAEPTPEPAGGTTRLMFWYNESDFNPDNPQPINAYEWNYYNNPDEQHIYKFVIYSFDFESKQIISQTSNVAYPGVSFSGNEAKIYGNGINIGGHSFIASCQPFYYDQLNTRGKQYMAGKTGPWMDIYCGWVDAGRLDWVPEAIWYSSFYGEPHPQVYGCHFYINVADSSNPFLEKVGINYMYE